jgi:DNA-3-methyladenine glycosylase II
LLQVRDVCGLPAHKVAALHAIARAALDGQLDPDVLRARPVDETMAVLRKIPGVGPYTAEGIIVRALGVADELPVCEPRVYRGVALAYGLTHTPDLEELTRIAEGWRPFRTWVSVLVCVLLRRSGKWAGAPGERTKFFQEVRPWQSRS